MISSLYLKNSTWVVCCVSFLDIFLRQHGQHNACWPGWSQPSWPCKRSPLSVFCAGISCLRWRIAAWTAITGPFGIKRWWAVPGRNDKYYGTHRQRAWHIIRWNYTRCAGPSRPITMNRTTKNSTDLVQALCKSAVEKWHPSLSEEILLPVLYNEVRKKFETERNHHDDGRWNVESISILW